MKRSRAWKSGGPGTGSLCYGSIGAGRTGIGGIGGRRSRRTYALSGIRPRCVRGLPSHNDNDPLQQIVYSVSVTMLCLFFPILQAWAEYCEQIPAAPPDWRTVGLYHVLPSELHGFSYYPPAMGMPCLDATGLEG